MRKRTKGADSEEEEAVVTPSDAESEDEKPATSKQRPKRQIAIKKPKFESEEKSEEEERPLKKRKKNEKSSPSKKVSKDVDVADPGALLVNESGEKYVDLGKKKRATVRVFKGTTFLDIREYYAAGGEDKPGKKGISLSAEQWAVLKDNAEILDILFKKSNK
ncbi:transcriptional Coactivator p15-domain-containing protein [Cytidiella melzeri]|nr:transcriptional Coactivator p15-domain-containing protein [Cytidiella melzeri]